MNTIDPKQIKHQINNCYEAYDPNWRMNIGKKHVMNGFKYHLEHTAGLKVEYEVNSSGSKLTYIINSVEIVDDPSFTMWLLKWS